MSDGTRNNLIGANFGATMRRMVDFLKLFRLPECSSRGSVTRQTFEARVRCGWKQPPTGGMFDQCVRVRAPEVSHLFRR